MGLSHDLEFFRVGTLPTIFYIPDYISSDDQTHLLHQVNVVSSSKWKYLKNRRLQNWGGVVHEKGLLPQKLPSWLSDLTGTICKDLGLYPSPINHVLINEYLPGQGIMSHQDGPAYFPVVSILSLGSPAVLHFSPHQRLLENNSDLIGEQLHKTVSVVLMPRSLLVFKDVAYEEYLHGISDCYEHNLDETIVNLQQVNLHTSLIKPEGFLSGTPNDDTKEHSKMKDARLKDSEHCQTGFEDTLKRNGTRISLTCRTVTKVHKNLFKI